MNRPIGITVLSLLLAWLAVAGAANSVVWNLDVVRELLVRLPKSERMPSLGGPVFSMICLTYGITAAVASIALWRMRSFAPTAYAAWCLAVLLTSAYLALIGPESERFVGILLSLGITVFVALGYPYVATRTKSARPNKSPERSRGE